MALLDNITDFASGATGVGTILSVGKGVAGMLGIGGNDQKKQLNAQKQLIDYQNQINQNNSLIAYQRQRELTKDNAFLQKLGKRNAGINTALGDGSVPSAASVGDTPSSSIPSPLPTESQISSQYSAMMNDASSSLVNVSLARSQQHLIDEQAENQRIRNITQLKRDIAEYTKLKNEAKNVADRNRYQNMLDDAESKYYKMNAKNRAWSLDDDTTMKDLQADLYSDMQNTELESKRAYYQNLLDTHDLNKNEKAFYQYKVKHILSQIALNNSNSKDALSHVGVNNSQTLDNLSHVGVNKAQARNLDSMSELNYITQYINDATKEDVIELAHRQLKEHGPQSISEDMWTIFNDWDHATGWQRLRAIFELPISAASDFYSGASHSAGASLGDKLGPEKNTYQHNTYTNSKGESSTYVRKKVKNYKPKKHK